MGISSGHVLDVGAGKGRNTFYMAKQGFDVYAIDYVLEAIAFIDKVAESKQLGMKIHTYCQGIDEKWPFEDEFFDCVIDSFASIDVETKAGREFYRDELFRTLKSGGYAMVTVVSADDEVEREMIRNYPGKEKNSSVWPQNGKFQKNYDQAELREFYKGFEIVALKKIDKKAHKLGRDFTATNFFLILKKMCVYCTKLAPISKTNDVTRSA